MITGTLSTATETRLRDMSNTRGMIGIDSCLLKGVADIKQNRSKESITSAVKLELESSLSSITATSSHRYSAIRIMSIKQQILIAIVYAVAAALLVSFGFENWASLSADETIMVNIGLTIIPKIYWLDLNISKFEKKK